MTWEGEGTAGSELTSADLRSAFDEILPRKGPNDVVGQMGVGNDDLAPGKAFLEIMAEGGWVTPTWPRPWGGRGAEPAEAELVASVLAEYVVPDLYAYAIGLYMVGPTLQVHGTPEQCERWLPRIANGQDVWCQLFSEPEAGSDLANVGLQARRDGDQWVLNGQKVWVSRAMWAQWGLLLARSDSEAPKHRGLTMFAVDMASPGIEVRPLVQMNGDRHFSEVFFNDVVIPDAQRIGELHGGWRVAMTVLAHERSLSGAKAPEQQGMEVPTWLRDLASEGRLDGAVARDRAMQAFVLGEVARLTAVRSRDGRAPGALGSLLKLLKGAEYRAYAYLNKDLKGAHGMLTEHSGHLDFLTAPSMSIRGGTDQIQRNIVAERVLGLPGEIRVDRDDPWSLTRRGLVEQR